MSEEKNDGTIYSYTDTDSGDRLVYGKCSTREQAIGEARARWPGKVVFIYQCLLASAGEFVPDADDIIELMNSRASDNAGECASEYPDGVSAEAKAELTAYLLAWAEKYAQPLFWVQIQGTEPERVVRGPQE